MTRKLVLVVFAALIALGGCGDDGLAGAPPTLTAGPVTIDTKTLGLTVSLADKDVLVQDHFLSIGTALEIDESHYYDPRGDEQVTLARVETAIGADGDWVVLEGGARMQLTECPVANCAALEIDASEHERAVQLQLTLPKEATEALYGTGDAPVRANVSGTVREMSLRVDLMSHSSLNETHVPVPLVMWPRRLVGMFVADDRPGAFDLGAANQEQVTATFTLPARGVYRVYFYVEFTPAALTKKYVELTAKPAVPPRWAFAPQQWRNVWNSSAEVRGDADEMRARKIPGSVMWIDNPWQTGYNTFVVDETRFVGPQQLIADLTAQGYKVLFWSTPYVGKTPELAADHLEGIQNQFFVTDDGGITVDWPWQNGPGAMVDFTRAGATAWWRERIKRVVAIGASGFKLDFGEELVPDLAGTLVPFLLAEGDNSSHHNRYAAGYHDAYLGALPPGDGFLITRAGAWGEQATNTAIWPGDLDSDFSEHGVIRDGKRNIGGLPTAISRGLSLSVSGYPFYGSDIGGFKGFPTTEALIRWAEYASFGTIMQLGGGGKSHNPWDTTLFAPGADAIYKTYAEQHMLLNPLLWTLAQLAGRTGIPVTQPAKFVYDCACDDAMFLLGDDILVAPVVTPGATTRTVVLPPGQWIERATGTLMTGNGRDSITVPAPLAVLPIWYRAGGMIAMFARIADTLLPATAAGVTSYTDPAYGSELRFIVAPVAVMQSKRELHDGAAIEALGSPTLFALTGGSQYTRITLDFDARTQPAPLSAPAAVSVDGTDLTAVADEAGLFACAAPGCYWFDAAAKHLQARVFAPQGQTKQVTVR